MKKLIIFLSILIFKSSYSQTLNGIPIQQLDVKYIEIVGTAKLLKLYDISIYVDYGQIGNLKDSFGGKGALLGSDGKPMSFNGMMDAVNFFSNYGYELSFAYPVSVPNSGSVYHYIMYKKDAKNTNANDVFSNKGNVSRDNMICKCNELMKKGQASSECQEFFKTQNLGTKEGKERYKADLIRLGCE